MRRGPREERLQIELLAKDKLTSLVSLGCTISTAILSHVAVLLVWSLLVAHYAADAVVDASLPSPSPGAADRRTPILE